MAQVLVLVTPFPATAALLEKLGPEIRGQRKVWLICILLLLIMPAITLLYFSRWQVIIDMTNPWYSGNGLPAEGLQSAVEVLLALASRLLMFSPHSLYLVSISLIQTLVSALAIAIAALMCRSTPQSSATQRPNGPWDTRIFCGKKFCPGRGVWGASTRAIPWRCVASQRRWQFSRI